MATSITEKPNRKISSLSAPKRGSNGSLVMTSKWSYPAYLTSDKNPGRCTGWEVWWKVNCYHLTTKKTTTFVVKRKTTNINAKDNSINLNSFVAVNGKTYSRTVNFYPVNGMWAIRSVSVHVRPYNTKGVGEWAHATQYFKQPRKPSISISQDNNGKIHYTITQNKGQDYRENHSTRYQVYLYNSRTKENKLVRDSSFWVGTSTTGGGVVDIPDRMLLTVNQYERITVKAWSRGMWGASEVVTKTYYVSWPMKPTIKGIDCGEAKTTSKVTIKIDTNYHPSLDKGIEHPVTGIRLETLVDQTYTKASQIPANAGWEPTDIVDDGNCTALSTIAANVWPGAGHTSWVRVKAWNDLENPFYLYSEPKRIKDLETPASTAADDEITIISVTAGDDGTSAVVLLGWDDDDSTGTEVTYSKDWYAWRSAKEPESFTFEWTDGPATIGGVSYDNTAEVYVPDLEEGTRYYFRARRYLEGEDAPTYGEWCDVKTVVPYAIPTVATLNASPSVARGSALTLSWTYDTDTAQRSWALITGATTTTTDVSNKEHTWIDEDSEVVVIALGDGEAGSTVIDAERMAVLTEGLDSIPLAIRVSTGSGTITSEAVTVHVSDAPALEMTLPSELTAQPLTFGVTSSVPADLIVIVTATGTPHEHPDGTREQPQGDTVWSAALEPEWTEVTEDDEVVGYTATVTAPEGLPLYQSADYDVLVRATDTRTGLTSEDVTGTIGVAYSHEPPVPPDEITVEPYDITNDVGIRTMGAVIHLATDNELAETDVYDVYRLTPDGAYLIAEDRQQDEDVDDPYAPFGEDVSLAYRVCVRTADGMEEWRDYPYALACGLTRVDWLDGYLELPYNLQLNEAWEKDFEARRHLDGTIDGYWNPGTQRTMTITTDLRKAWDEAATRAVRQLAAHAGPCLVRTHTGLCFMANVQPSSFSWAYNSNTLPMGFDVTEIELLDDFAAILPDSPPDSEE